MGALVVYWWIMHPWVSGQRRVWVVLERGLGAWGGPSVCDLSLIFLYKMIRETAACE